MRDRASALALSVLCSALISANTFAADSTGEPGRSAGGKNPLNNVYFGEQHLHTSDSPDAFAMGTRNTPDDAYRFCKGEAIKKLVDGTTVQKKTPYDWCAVTDHAVFMGMLPLMLDKSNKSLHDSEIGKLINSGKPEDGAKAFQTIITAVSAGTPPPYLMDPKTMSTVWEKQKAITNKHNDPGKFTTLIAYEWTSIPFAQNLHHNVFFRDDKGPQTVFSALDSVKREDLWTYQEVQRAMGHENFSIPHNGNVSNGMMFAPTTSYGNTIDAHWAKRLNRNTVATEIIQTKGQSETHPALSPNDEFAGFETHYKHLLGSGGVVSRINNGYVRRALTDGVGFQEMIGANPWKLGIVAGADSHDAFSDNEEFNYQGVHGNTDNTPKIRLTSGTTVAGEPPIHFGSPGTTAVWAPENTRTAIFDAIKNKETYGTSGTFIKLRFFGGWNYADDLSMDRNFVRTAYKEGVPMGGDLKKKPAKAKAPTFAVWALKDPESANLDRVQIVKGWYKDGHPWEKVYDVVWSDNRKVDKKTGKLPPVGNTVDIKNASYTNSIGDTQLSAVWTDPDFEPSQHAVYYSRVLEIPTPRWTTYDAKALGVEPPAGVPATIQERAWSSPIWYTPEANLVKRAPFYPGLKAYLP